MKSLSFDSLVFLFFCLLPFLSFRILELDLQPYFFVGALLVVVRNISLNLKIPICYYLTLPALFCSLVYLVLSSDVFLGVRGFFNYSSPMLIILAAYYVCNRGVDFDFVFKCSAIIYFVAALMQYFLGVYSLDFLTVVRTTEGRGVTSLTPEPTFYGMVMIFHIIYAIVFSSFKNKIPYILFCAVQILFLAKSSMASLFLVVILSISIVCYLRVKSLFFIGLGLSALAFMAFMVVNQVDQSLRIIKLAKLIMNDPLFAIVHDASINQRVQHIFFSLHGAIYNFLIPQGFESYLPYLRKVRPEFSGFFWSGGFGNKIMSGIGGALFEMGVFGLLILIACYKSFTSLGARDFFFLASSTFLVMLTAIPIAFPIFYLFVGMALSRFNNNQVA